MARKHQGGGKVGQGAGKEQEYRVGNPRDGQGKGDGAEDPARRRAQGQGRVLQVGVHCREDCRQGHEGHGKVGQRLRQPRPPEAVKIEVSDAKQLQQNAVGAQGEGEGYAAGEGRRNEG